MKEDKLGNCIDHLKISLYKKRITKDKKQEKQEERTISSITRYLQEHFSEEISLSVLAEEFHLNSQYISQLFKSEGI